MLIVSSAVFPNRGDVSKCHFLDSYTYLTTKGCSQIFLILSKGAADQKRLGSTDIVYVEIHGQIYHQIILHSFFHSRIDDGHCHRGLQPSQSRLTLRPQNGRNIAQKTRSRLHALHRISIHVDFRHGNLRHDDSHPSSSSRWSSLYNRRSGESAADTAAKQPSSNVVFFC